MLKFVVNKLIKKLERFDFIFSFAVNFNNKSIKILQIVKISFK
jgi:hypothetical protein